MRLLASRSVLALALGLALAGCSPAPTPPAAVSAEQVQAILQAQLPREERLHHADDVVVNDGDLGHLHAQIDRLHNFYLTLRGGQP